MLPTVRRATALAVGGVILAIAAAAPAVADSSTPRTARDAPGGGLGVSMSAEPIRAVPGTTVQLPLRVTNPTSASVAVRIEQRALHVGDGGELQILDGPDPRWIDNLVLPAGRLNVPPRGHRDVDVVLRVPTLSPDIHLIGVLVTPTAQAAGVRVVTAVGAPLAIDVPGPRDRRLEGSMSMPAFVWGASHDAELLVRNVGRSSLRFWGEYSRDRIERTLLPAGRQRSVATKVDAPLGIGVKTVDARIFYNRTDAEVVQLEFSRRVLFVHPAYTGTIAAITVVSLLAVARGHARRRRPASRPKYAI